MMTGNRYWERMEYLEDRIQGRQMLKKAQIPDNAHYRFFQATISTLTDELRNWERKISRIDRLEAEIAAVDRQASVEAQDAWHVADTRRQFAIACGLIGAPLLLLGLAWSPSLLLPVIGGMLWVLAVVAAQQSMKARTCAQQVETEALDRLAQLGARRNALIPSRSAE
jgi:hypothetical protein